MTQSAPRAATPVRVSSSSNERSPGTGTDDKGRGSRRVRMAPPDRAWGLAFVMLTVWVLALTALGRQPGYDEATFISQSGPLDDNGAHPFAFEPSREIGSRALVHLLRWFSSDISELRLLWLLVHMAAVVLAFAMMGRQVGRRAALVGLGIFATMWVPTIFFVSIYGMLMSSAGALLSTALYLRCRDEPPERVWPAVALGMALSLMFWFRSLEAVLVLTVLVLHAAAWKPRSTLARWRGVLATVGTFALLFVLPWTAQRIGQFGSLSAWFAAARSQPHLDGSTGPPAGLYNGLGEYLRMFIGHGGNYEPVRRPPGWLAAVAGGGLLFLGLAAVVVVVGGLRRGQRDGMRAPRVESHREAGLVLVLAESAVCFAFFFFLYSRLRERYVLFGLIFLAVLGGVAVTKLMTFVSRAGRGGRVCAAVVLGLAGVLWLSSQAFIAHEIEAYRVANGKSEAAGATVIATLAHRLSSPGHRHPCVLLGLASTSRYQLLSGCRVDGGLVGDGKLIAAIKAPRWRITDVFVIWYARDQKVAHLLKGYDRIDAPGGREDLVLFYRLGTLKPATGAA
jgi:hypothetical protein